MNYEDMKSLAESVDEAADAVNALKMALVRRGWEERAAESAVVALLSKQESS